MTEYEKTRIREDEKTRRREYKTIDMKMMTIRCPRCGRETSFETARDAIDEDGEIYRCRQCGWPFWWRDDGTKGRSSTSKSHKI